VDERIIGSSMATGCERGLFGYCLDMRTWNVPERKWGSLGKNYRGGQALIEEFNRIDPEPLERILKKTKTDEGEKKKIPMGKKKVVTSRAQSGGEGRNQRVQNADKKKCRKKIQARTQDK